MSLLWLLPDYENLQYVNFGKRPPLKILVMPMAKLGVCKCTWKIVFKYHLFKSSYVFSSDKAIGWPHRTNLILGLATRSQNCKHNETVQGPCAHLQLHERLTVILYRLNVIIDRLNLLFVRGCSQLSTFSLAYSFSWTQGSYVVWKSLKSLEFQKSHFKTLKSHEIRQS
jgi:hypothetical protein